jgi:hypothetical protein
MGTIYNTSRRYARDFRDVPLAFVPFSAELVNSANPLTTPVAVSAAAANQRRFFSDLTGLWLRATPDNPAAMEARGIALEIAGDPTAIDLYRKARHIAVSPTHRMRYAVEELWLLTKLGLAGSRRDLATARSLADSLLAESSMAADSLLLVSVALLFGRTDTALRATEGRPLPHSLSPAISRELYNAAGRLEIAVAAGLAQADVLRFEEESERLLRAMVSTEDQATVAATLSGQAALLAFPTPRLAVSSRLAAANPLIYAQNAYLAGRLEVVDSVLSELQMRRAGFALNDISLDALWVHSWLLAAMDREEAAADLLDARFAALPLLSPHALSSPSICGAVLRLLALRAVLPVREARREAAFHALRTLWPRESIDEIIDRFNGRGPRPMAGLGAGTEATNTGT